MEPNADTGKRYMTQWYERNRFELHPEHPAPYDVLLGRLGADRLAQLGRDWSAEGREPGPRPGCLWFAQTGHNVCNQSPGDGAQAGFRNYWQTEGLKDSRLDAYQRSLALHGLPLTAARMETNASGDTVLTQWFERDRLEWHPNNPKGFRVQLGLLGSELRGVTPPPSGDSGEQIAYTERNNILLLDLKTQQTQPLVSDGSSNDPAWSRDGKWLAFASIKDGNPEIYMVRADGTGRTRVTHTAVSELQPAFSGDGTLFFVRHDYQRADPFIQIVKHAASGAESIVYSQPGGLCSPTDLSFDAGTHWALSITCGRGKLVLVGDLNSQRVEDIAEKYGLDGSCAYTGVWAHDRPDILAVLTSGNCQPQARSTISTLDIRSAEPPREPVYLGTAINTLDWSPDNRRLVFDKAAGGASDGLYLVSIGTQDTPRKIGSGSQPAWRP
jgi:hypothetical protein